jgi:hypothetical protein
VADEGLPAKNQVIHNAAEAPIPCQRRFPVQPEQLALRMQLPKSHVEGALAALLKTMEGSRSNNNDGTNGETSLEQTLHNNRFCLQ